MKKLSTLGLLLLAFTVFAQKTYDIKLNLKKGETYSVLSDIKMDMVQKVMGQEMPMKMDIVMAYSYKVLSVDKDLYTLEGKYNYIRNDMEMMGRNMKMASNINDENPANKMFAGMVNVPFTMKVKPNGDVVSVEGYEKVIERMKNALPENMREEGTKEFEKSFSKDQVAQTFKSTFFSIPPKPVKIGDTWEAVYGSQSNGLELTNKMTCKLDAVENGVYKISYIGNLAAKEGTSIEKNGMKMDVKKMTGTMTGNLALDKKTSWVKNSANKADMNLQLEMKMGDSPMPMESDIKMDFTTTDQAFPNPPAPSK